MIRDFSVVDSRTFITFATANSMMYGCVMYGYDQESTFLGNFFIPQSFFFGTYIVMHMPKTLGGNLIPASSIR